MFITNEYSRLYGIDCDDVVLLPNQPFEAFKGKYKVGAYARVQSEGEKDIFLQAGDVIKGIGIVKTLEEYIQDIKKASKIYLAKTRRKEKAKQVRIKKEVKDDTN